MDFQISEEEAAVSELARQILGDLVTNERLKELEGRAISVDEQVWKGLAEANLLGVAIAEEHGGMDLGYFALCLLLQEIGRSVAPAPVYPSLALGALPLSKFGSDEAKRAWLPRVAKGELVLTAALSELDSSDPLQLTTRATYREGGYVLDGEKTTVPAAEQSARILVPAAFDDGRIALFWIEPGTSGVTLTPQRSSDGQPAFHIALRGVPVSANDVLCGPDEGGDALRWVVEHAITARCAMQLGVLERALEMTADYSRERIQFERPIGSFQAVHQRAADAYIQIEAIRLSTWEAAWRLASDLDASDSVSVAKYWAAEGGSFASYACQHLHGGIGIDVDYPLHRYFKWAIQIEHELGCAPVQLDRMGARIAEVGPIQR